MHPAIRERACCSHGLRELAERLLPDHAVDALAVGDIERARRDRRTLACNASVPGIDVSLGSQHGECGVERVDTGQLVVREVRNVERRCDARRALRSHRHLVLQRDRLLRIRAELDACEQARLTARDIDPLHARRQREVRVPHDKSRTDPKG